MTIKGSDRFRQLLRQLGPKYREAVKQALREEAEEISAKSQENTPVQYGALKGSHQVGEPTVEAGKIGVTISVGGPSAPYALAVHEHLSEHSPPSWKAAEDAGRPVRFTTGGPKFLENAVTEAADGFAERVGERIEAFMEEM